MEKIITLYDHQIFSVQKYGGISRYYIELLREFSNREDIEAQLAIKYSSNEYLKDTEYNIKKIPKLNKCSIESKINYGLNLANSIGRLKDLDYDVFHPTYYDPYFINFVSNKPVVVTVYDLIHERFPCYFNKAARNTTMKKKVIERADKIIAISESTKTDLINLLGVNADKIQVIYLSSSFNLFLNKIGETLCLPDNFILFVGTRGGYKNFDLFFEATSTLLIENPQLYMICFGGGPFNHEETQKVQNLKLDKQVLNIQGNDSVLAQLYSKALAFIFPSLYEGFGIPALEAMSCGCPTILSNSSSLIEVGGDAAIYLNPFSLDSIRETIVEVVNSKYLRKELTEKGFKQAQLFSWEKSAEDTIKLYRSLL